MKTLDHDMNAIMALIDNLLGSPLEWKLFADHRQVLAACDCPSDEVFSLLRTGLQIANYPLWVYWIGDDNLAETMTITIRNRHTTIRRYIHQTDPA